MYNRRYGSNNVQQVKHDRGVLWPEPNMLSVHILLLPVLWPLQPH